MIPNTQSFIRLRKEQQNVLNFIVLICHAVPNLRKTIKGVNAEIPKYGIAKPFYFNQESLDTLESYSRHYKINIAKYALISIFSFFESYFKSVVEELIEFHGGKEKFSSSLLEKHKSLMLAQNQNNINDIKKKVQE